jgi:predicted CXXCH cytochrome family protein
MRRRHAARALILCALSFGFALGAVSAAHASTESTYTAWVDSVAYHDQPHATPHRDYATTTTKCAVCHAVHKAPADGELLLRSTVGEACVYCHVDSSLGVIVIYGGKVDNYSGVDTDHGHQAPAVECSDCHSVHGANTFGGPAETKILKVFGIQQSLVDYTAGGDTAAVINGVGPFATPPALVDEYNFSGWRGGWQDGDVQDAAFCSQCHPYFSNASETTITAQVVQSDGSFVERSFKTHPLKRPGGETGRSFYDGDYLAGGSTLPISATVAVMGGNGCMPECHSSPGGPNGESGSRDQAPGGDSNNSYPHYNSYTSRFLTGGTDPSDESNPVANSNDDAACLYCHTWGADHNWPGMEAGGVGSSY